LKEVEELKEFARKNGFDNELALWDMPYWSERLREFKFGYEEEELKTYFPLTQVLDGLFSLAERLFNIKIKNSDGKVQVWNDQVM